MLTYGTQLLQNSCSVGITAGKAKDVAAALLVNSHLH